MSQRRGKKSRLADTGADPTMGQYNGSQACSYALRSATAEQAVIYRGIKIAQMSGKRSATAKAIRDALRTKSEQTTRGRRAPKPPVSKSVFVNCPFDDGFKPILRVMVFTIISSTIRVARSMRPTVRRSVSAIDC
jgi:hypothetical protein